MKTLNLSRRVIGTILIAATLIAPAASFAGTRFDAGRDGHSAPAHTAAPAMRSYASASRISAPWPGDTARACMHSPGSLNFEPCFGR